MKPRSVIVLILLMLFLIVIVQNTEVVSVRLLFWDFVMSRIILLALSLSIGIVIGFLLGRPGRKQKQFAITKQPPKNDRT
jgi:uncharacterized integral membrane protein